MGEADVTRGLPSDLASVLRDQSVIVPQDAAVFELIAAWAKAPALTASAGLRPTPNEGLFEVLRRQGEASSSTTPSRCY